MLIFCFLQSIKQYRKSFHDHDPSVHLDGDWQPTIPVGTLSSMLSC